MGRKQLETRYMSPHRLIPVEGKKIYGEGAALIIEGDRRAVNLVYLQGCLKAEHR
jgi:hypothetical protein